MCQVVALFVEAMEVFGVMYQTGSTNNQRSELSDTALPRYKTCHGIRIMDPVDAPASTPWLMEYKMRKEGLIS
jgi:hypothetical protein